ncbi:hypothetical protein IJD34_10045, partial [bacterium]|nr:hypothetical protein [bacterium]
MSFISKNNFILDEEEENIDFEPYTLPKLVTTKPEVISVKKSVAISALLHPGAVFLVWLISVILTLSGINLALFNKVKPQPKRDIE